MPGDYFHYQAQNRNMTVDGSLSAGCTVTVVPKNANHRLYIQKVQVAINTHANAKTITLGDGTLTIGTINDLTAAAGVPDVVLFDFGPKGRALTLGGAFSITSASRGPVADGHIECYEKLDATISHAAGASSQ